LGGLHPRTYSGALTRTRRRRSFCALCSCLRVASTIPKEVNITPGRTLGKCHLATGASHEKTPRARGALCGRGRALACPGTQTHVPVCLKSRVRSVFLHHLCLKAAWRLLQLCVAALAGRCWALGGLHPRTYRGALTRTRRRRSFCAARQHNLEKGRFPCKIQLQSVPHPVFRLVITLEVVAAAAGALGWEGEAGDHG
jgi:hypothetical protein